MTRLATGLSLLAIVASCGTAAAETVTVAVASNFVQPLKALQAVFESRTPHQVRTVSGSTGKLYAQIVNGAPYDVFLAADTERPARLLAAGDALAGSGFVYASGIIVLWSPSRSDSLGCLLQLHRLDFEHLAIANETLAPYGLAARQWLEQRGIWTAVAGRLVRGESIAQAYHFVASGNAQLGLVAKAQLVGTNAGGCHYEIPADFHEPILQQGVLLRHAAGNVAAAEFIALLRSDEVAALIEFHGYRRPQQR